VTISIDDMNKRFDTTDGQTEIHINIARASVILY